MIGSVWLDRVGIALLHSLWQGSLVGLALLAALLLLRHATAQARYVISCLALVLMVLLPVGTFWIARPEAPSGGGVEAPAPSRLVTSAAAALEAAASLLPAEFPQEPHPASSARISAAASPVESHRPWLSSPAKTLLTLMVAAWGCGVMLLAARVLGGYFVACRLARRQIEPLDDVWQGRFRQLVARFQLAMPVEIWQSACIQAPVVIGAFRPVILVPLGILTGLPAAQIEAILAHELAHVRRYDFLVNAVQCVFETLLFYHPCAWWISARIRAEREHCCDDLAVAACGDALVYARALNSLEERRSPSRLALALSGGGSLLSRVRRIVGQRRASDVVGSWLAGSLAIVLPMAVGSAWLSGRSSHTSNVGLAESRVAEGQAGNHASSEAEEALFRNAIKLTNDLADTLAAVTDATTAAAAAEKIVELSRRHAEVERGLRELRRSMAPETEARLEQRWLDKIERSSHRLREEVSRVGRIPGAVDALRSSVLFAVIGLNRESLPAESLPDEVDFLVPAGSHRRDLVSPETRSDECLRKTVRSASSRWWSWDFRAISTTMFTSDCGRFCPISATSARARATRRRFTWPRSATSIFSQRKLISAT